MNQKLILIMKNCGKKIRRYILLLLKILNCLKASQLRLA